ncbi:MAG: hypothetical protein GX896_03130 [Clostridiales bacterium]|nr:hypothetical protein [Clostridiales bacterium]
MIEYENNCVGCPTCIDCGKKREPRYICVICGDVEGLKKDEYGTVICNKCLLKSATNCVCVKCGDERELRLLKGMILCTDCYLDEFEGI